MDPFTLCLVAPWLIALGLTPMVERLSRSRDWMDHPRGRKQHTASVPLMGGIAVFLAAVIGVAVAGVLDESARGLWLGRGSLGALALGAGAILALGAYDDLYDVPAWPKFGCQLAIAGATWMLGFRVGTIELPFGWVIANAEVPSFLMTVGWIVIVTNAFNLIDGVDGLVAGTAIAASLTVFLLAFDNGANVPVLAALAMAGALAGFLRFNLPPARIFLGDAGAMMIGYVIAVMAMASYQKSPTAVVVIVPLLALGLPLFDTIWAILRRAVGHLRRGGRERVAPLALARAVMTADRGHVHHLLLRSGWSVRRTLFALYALSAVLCVCAVWLRSATPTQRWGFWLVLLGGGFAALRAIESRVERAEELRARETAGARELGGSHRAAG
jgi:UDP-GlcNAc:undecaprenyl-phosphate GlcNAc-1-phosphate transferase